MHIRRTVQATALLIALVATACAGDGPTVAAGPSVTEMPTSSPSADATTSPRSVTSPTPTPGAEIEDGKHFVFVKDAKAGRPGTVRFDLAYFLTGDEANQAAQDNGDEVPVPNDYYIVNDNPKLRTVPVADDAVVLAYDWSACCGTYTHLTFDGFAAYVADPTEDFHGTLSPYWIRVKGGEIVKIQEQYLP